MGIINRIKNCCCPCVAGCNELVKKEEKKKTEIRYIEVLPRYIPQRPSYYENPQPIKPYEYNTPHYIEPLAPPLPRV